MAAFSLNVRKSLFIIIDNPPFVNRKNAGKRMVSLKSLYLPFLKFYFVFSLNY